VQEVRYDIHGVAQVLVCDASARDVAAVTRELGTASNDRGLAADIVIRFVDRLLGSRPVLHLGPTAACAGDAFFVFAGKGTGRRAAQVALDRVGEQMEITCERGISTVPLLSSLVSAVLLNKQVLSLHAAAFVFRGTGVAVLGWPRSGKTSALLGFMARGADFVSDDRVYVGEAGERLSGVDRPLELRASHLADRPEYRARLGRREKARLRANGLLSASERLAAPKAPRRHVSRKLWERATNALAARLSVDVHPHTLFGDSTVNAGRLDCLFVTVTHTGPDVHVEPIDRDEARMRIGSLLEQERLPLTDACLRYRFAFPRSAGRYPERAAELEHDLLARLLARTPAYAVRHPRSVATRRLYEAMVPYCT
jgi:hypothetical protein